MSSGQSQHTPGRIIIVGVQSQEVQELETILRCGGFVVTCAPNGPAVLSMVQDPPVDLILLDNNSSNLNGFEDYRCLKQDARTRTVPMLFFCDKQDADVRSKGFAAGCVDCISKPYLDEEVLHRVRTHVTLHRLQHPPADPAETAESQPQSAGKEGPGTFSVLNGGGKDLQDGKTAISNRLRFEQMISNLSARLIHLPPHTIDDEIERALKKVLEFFQVDRCGLLHLLPDEDSWEITHVAYSEYAGPIPKGAMLPRSIHPWAFEKLAKKGEVVSIAKLSDVPEGAHADRETWMEWGVKSDLVIPLLKNQSVIHAIAIHSMQGERTWPEEFIPRLQLLGEIFVSALERRKSEQALRESEEKLNLAASSAEAGLWVMNVDTGRIWATDKLRDVLHFKPDEPLSFERFLEVVHPDDREKAKATLARSLKTRDMVSLEYRIVPPDGSVRWIISRGRSYPAAQGHPQRVMGVAVDITARKAMEAKLLDQIDEIQQLKTQLEKENIYLRDEIMLQREHEGVVSRSKAMKRVLAQVEQVAGTEAIVLLQGETGTGKDLLARTIHNLSQRKDRPLVTINCAVLPPTLIENELFGREKGAYTGAMTRMAGRFEAAHRSTLFLDEIGELQLDLQAKLLRVLDEGRFERLGSTDSLKVDVRIIVATNRDLAQEVALGKFRSDLYYRLKVFPIMIPPLRERPQDIAPLVWMFIKRFEEKIGKRIEHVSRKSLEALQHYHWPGNARELRNVVEHAMITCRDRTLHFRLPLPAAEENPISDKMVDVERAHIMSVLKKTGWRISGKGGTAEILGMKRTTLHSKIQKLGIQRPTSN
jgi:formate hydrogenlyase transcriptional activator